MSAQSAPSIIGQHNLHEKPRRRPLIFPNPDSFLFEGDTNLVQADRLQVKGYCLVVSGACVAVLFPTAG